jgi:hypothetical protein
MNNSELVERVEQFVATNRFSNARKAALAEFIGKQYRVSGILSRVSNTTGYLRRKSLRKGKTIVLRLAESDTVLSIRCTHSRSISIANHDISTPFIITVLITGYDEVRQRLGADELGDINLPGNGEEASSTAIGEDHKTQTPTHNENNELLAELQQMQLESQHRLSEVAADITKAQSRNVSLVLPEPHNQDVVEAKVLPNKSLVQSPDKNKTVANRVSSQSKAIPSTSHVAPNSATTENDETLRSGLVVSESHPTAKNAPSESIQNESQQLLNAENDISRSKLEVTGDNKTQSRESRLDQLRDKLLGDQQNPIAQKDIDQIVALKTGVPIEKVKEVQKHLWHTIMSPLMFGEQRVVFNFFPFGDFRLKRNRDVVNPDFKSAPVPQLANHHAVAEYPHSHFDDSNNDSKHPPIATHAIRIAATVAPLVGLSPPVTYDVIFETLQLLLKIFAVGKRRVRFTDVGEFFPVVLRGTLQYHFRPYRPLIRFATESFRALIAMAEHEGEGQQTFNADNGVPDRTIPNNKYSQTGDRRKKVNSSSLGCIIIVLAFVGLQLLLYLFD